MRFWLPLAALISFGRLFQSGVLWPEEGLPLAAARQILAGDLLYRDIWFDKPPLLAWLYAAFLLLAPQSILALRFLGVLYILAISWTGFLLARRWFDLAAARSTAFLLAFFLTFYHPSATVPLAADLLLLLPHLAAFYFQAASRPLAAGLCAGLAFHLNSKAVLVLLAASAAGPVIPLLAGFALAILAGLAPIALTGAWAGYFEQVWQWGASYAGTPFSSHPWQLGLERTAAWLGFHAALILGAALFLRRPSAHRRTILLWIALSLLGVAAGARFFPRYYFQLLPALAVAAGAGWALLPRRPILAAALALSLLVPTVRFGRLNLRLALGRSFEWRDTAIDASSRRAAALVARLTSPGDPIFVWGFRPEIYYYARRPAASRFLESQPLTGVLADRHLGRSDAFLPEQAARRRRQAALELAQRPPAVIVDGLGPYNPNLSIELYPEFRSLLDNYRPATHTPGARLWRRSGP